MVPQEDFLWRVLEVLVSDPIGNGGRMGACMGMKYSSLSIWKKHVSSVDVMFSCRYRSTSSPISPPKMPCALSFANTRAMSLNKEKDFPYRLAASLWFYDTLTNKVNNINNTYKIVHNY